MVYALSKIFITPVESTVSSPVNIGFSYPLIIPLLLQNSQFLSMQRVMSLEKDQNR